MAYILLGALLLIAGVVYMARAAIFRGRFSDPGPNPNDTGRPTLEPRHVGLGLLGVRSNWPGIAMIVLGVILFVIPLL